MRRLACTLALLLLGSGAAGAQQSTETLAGALKPYLISAIPAVLHEKTENWGHQVMVPVGIKFRGVKPQIQKSPRNHGEWRKLIITAQDLKRTLDLQISDIKNVDAEHQTFKVFFTFQAGVLYDQQNWESGARLWSGSVEARAQLKLHLECENTLRLELGKDLFPDLILRVRVTKARVEYDNLVVQHIAGIGGSGAKIIGRTVHDVMKQWRPSIERDLLNKASASILKAADTREVRIGFSGLVKLK